MIKKNDLKRRVITSIFLLALFILMYLNNMLFLFVVLIACVYSFLEFSRMIKMIFKQNIGKQLIINVIFCLYVFLLSTLIVVMSINPHSKMILFLIILVSVLSDIGGYIFGKILKGPKLTKISPNKTLAGSLGSIVFPTLIFLIFLRENFIFNQMAMNLLLIFVISIFTQIGDIIISFVKRKSKVKDTGKLLPGHGGILDRIDGMLLGIPLGLIFIILIS